MPAWPSSVPLTLVTDFPETGPAGGFIATPFDRGPPMRRKVSSSGIRPVNITVAALRLSEVAAFETWYEVDLGSGALTFTMPHPRSGILRRFAFSDPSRPYTITPVTTDRSSITMALDLYPR